MRLWWYLETTCLFCLFVIEPVRAGILHHLLVYLTPGLNEIVAALDFLQGFVQAFDPKGLLLNSRIRLEFVV